MSTDRLLRLEVIDRNVNRPDDSPWRQPPRPTLEKVAVITGASQGSGAALAETYHELRYGVVATSRNISASRKPEVLTVQGDIASPVRAERVGQAGDDA
ncbi:hypothetical protein ACFZAU_40365 [Streptomyces sp. NPDC008238]